MPAPAHTRRRRSVDGDRADADHPVAVARRVDPADRAGPVPAGLGLESAMSRRASSRGTPPTAGVGCRAASELEDAGSGRPAARAPRRSGCRGGPPVARRHQRPAGPGTERLSQRGPRASAIVVDHQAVLSSSLGEPSSRSDGARHPARRSGRSCRPGGGTRRPVPRRPRAARATPREAPVGRPGRGRAVHGRLVGRAAGRSTPTGEASRAGGDVDAAGQDHLRSWPACDRGHGAATAPGVVAGPRPGSRHDSETGAQHLEAAPTAARRARVSRSASCAVRPGGVRPHHGQPGQAVRAPEVHAGDTEGARGACGRRAGHRGRAGPCPGGRPVVHGDVVEEGGQRPAPRRRRQAPGSWSARRRRPGRPGSARARRTGCRRGRPGRAGPRAPPSPSATV